jgi:RNase P/RNase MRP subunit p29
MVSFRPLLILLLGASLGAGAFPAQAQAPSTTPSMQRIRGTVVSINGTALQLKTDGGQNVAVKLADKYSVSARARADASKVVPGAFLGATAIPGPDGTLIATEVHIFPESMRGRGEGHRPMDAAAGSTMTNATVATVAMAPPAVSGRTMTNATVTTVAGTNQEKRMTLQYKGGEKVIAIPNDTPIVMVEQGDPAMLVPGAHVIVAGVKQNDGSMLVDRVWVGKDGFVPPL